MKINRQSVVFEVADHQQTSSWGFWKRFADGSWEPETLAAMDEILKPGDLLFDIGAWVGPITIWEAKRGIRVLALEPDPGAFGVLMVNIVMNNLRAMATPLRVAVASQSGPIKLYSDKGWSGSSITHAIENALDADGVMLETLISKYGVPDLIKMDIEGGESLVLPSSGHQLRGLGVPLLLSLHPHWYAEGSGDAMAEELSEWNIIPIGRNSASDTILCRPRP